MVPEDGALDSAVRILERELESGRGPRAYAPLSEAYRRQGRLEDAVRVARAGVQAFPRHVAIHVVLGRALADAGRPDQAREVYREVLRLDPESAEARGVLGRLSACCEREAPGAEAAAAVRSTGKQASTLSEELAHLSDLFSARPDGAYSTGERDFPGIATLTLAEIYARQGLTQRAVEVCETILERRPDDSTARTRLEHYRRSLSALR